MESQAKGYSTQRSMNYVISKKYSWREWGQSSASITMIYSVVYKLSTDDAVLLAMLFFT